MRRRGVTYRWVVCIVRDSEGPVRDFQEILNYDVKHHNNLYLKIKYRLFSLVSEQT